MEAQLLEAVKTNKKGDLKRFLRVYSTVDRVGVAETLVRKKIVAPQLDEILTDKALAAEPTGLKGLFQKCMRLTETTLRPLVDLTHGASGSTAARDFSFLVRCVSVVLLMTLLLGT